MSSAPESGSGPAPVPPTVAEAVFGEHLDDARAYAQWLAGEGVVRGLLGPREVGRIWERHLLNCAVLTDLVAPGARVVDVGSGAGLPGLPMALRRPDLALDLVEPMQRRAGFLTEVVDALGLGERVRVVRGRADDRDVRNEVGSSNWVTARAVAPLDRLVEWCLPLLTPGGRLLALKGARATDEVAEHRATLGRNGAAGIEVQSLGREWGLEPTWVVTVTRAAGWSPRGGREDKR